MQDSLEDYIRIARNSKEPPPQVKKEVLVTGQIKQDCDAKALQIFQFAVEGKMRPDALFKCLPFINQSHYQDIVEERAITKLCGYPLCSKRIPDMPKKQFYISTKSNKVYDITDRKHYCSNYCYKASIHVKHQIDTSPLWLRKCSEKAQFTLLHKTEKGLPGELVDQGIPKSVVESRFTSIFTFTQMSLDEAEELELNPQEEESKSTLKKPKKFKKTKMKTINENEEEEQIESDDKKLSITEKPISVQSIDKPIKEHKVAPIYHKPTLEIDVESQIKKCFKEWITLETFIFIHGEDNIQEKMDSQKVGDYFESLKIAELQLEQQKRYMDICKKLHLRELAEEKFDSVVVGGGNKILQPVPDYHKLKDEGKEMDLKVKSFFTGELHVREDSNFPTRKKNQSETLNEGEGPPVVLPMVDTNSQNALRRKIFLNSLNKTVQTLLQTLRINPSSVLSDLQSLCKTFKLKADNIVFKPALWNYIAIVLLKILALTNDNLRCIFEEERTKTQLQLWLSSLPNQQKIIDDVLKILSDIDSFVEDYIICK